MQACPNVQMPYEKNLIIFFHVLNLFALIIYVKKSLRMN